MRYVVLLGETAGMDADAEEGEEEREIEFSSSRVVRFRPSGPKFDPSEGINAIIDSAKSSKKQRLGRSSDDHNQRSE